MRLRLEGSGTLTLRAPVRSETYNDEAVSVGGGTPCSNETWKCRRTSKLKATVVGWHCGGRRLHERVVWCGPTNDRTARLFRLLSQAAPARDRLEDGDCPQ